MLGTHSTHELLHNIKNTYSILNTAYKHLSLIHGVIAWEMGVIRHLYDAGQIFPTFKNNSRGRKVIESYEKLDETHKVIRLIHALFYRIPRSTSETDFGVTQQINVLYTAPKIAETIATILVSCDIILKYHKTITKTVQKLLNLPSKNSQLSNLKSMLNDIILEDSYDHYWYNALQKKLESLKTKDPLLLKNNPLLHDIDEFVTALSVVNFNMRSMLQKSTINRQVDFGQLVLESLVECDNSTTQPAYPKYTIHMILQAFVYKTCGHDRDALKLFYTRLNELLDDNVLTSQLPENWVADTFKPIKPTTSLEIIKDIFNTRILEQNINQNYENLVYNFLQIQKTHNFAKPIGFRYICYEYAKNKSTQKFPNCMENGLLNFINLFAYDIESNQLSLETLLKNMNLKKVHPALAGFLEQFKKTSETETDEAHAQWLSLVSNIPYAAYNQIINTKSGENKVRKDDDMGFVAIPEKDLLAHSELKNNLDEKHYNLMSRGWQGFELIESVKNIIIILNHILDLNLFSENTCGEEIDLAKAFIRHDFIKIYFQLLCKKLGATGSLAIEQEFGEISDASTHANFDSMDHTNALLHAYFNLANIECVFYSTISHATVKLLKSPTLNNEPALQLKNLLAENKSQLSAIKQPFSLNMLLKA